MASNVPVAPSAPKVDPAAQAAQNEAKLVNDIKALLLYEMRSSGYSPNPADVVDATARLRALVADAGGSAAAYVGAVEAKLKAYEEHEVAKATAAAAAEAAKSAPATSPAPAKPVVEPGAPIPAVPAKV